MGSFGICGVSGPRGRLAGRRIVVTAGPTWAPLDAVRHIGNLSTGRTGVGIARRLARRGAAVTLVAGPLLYPIQSRDRRLIRVLDIVTFEQMAEALERELRDLQPLAVVHAAAVADYLPVDVSPGKMPSDRPELLIRLRPAPKLVRRFREWGAQNLIVMFKLEVGVGERELENRARRALEAASADYCVANDLADKEGGSHPYRIFGVEGQVACGSTPEALINSVEGLIQARSDMLESREADR